MAEHADDAVRPPATRATSMLNGTGPNGHSYVLAINEYCQRHFRADVRYVFARCDPDYSATAVLDGLTYATRKDPNKHVAKILAAKSTAEVLLPEMRDLAEDECLPDAYKLAVFDNVDLADERIPEITMPYDAVKPYKILLKCLARNFGYREADIQFTTHRPANQYCPARLALKVGSYSVTVPMTRFAKQEAAQTILMNVHPHLESWGSLIRMYIVNTARDFEDMTMLAGIQNVAMQPLDADIDDGLPPGEDKGEPRAAFRGGGVAGGVPADDSEDSDSEDDEDDDEDGDDEDDEYDEEEHCCCREQCVLQVVHLSDSDEGEDLSDQEDDDEDDEDDAKAEPERDANFNLCEERARCGGADRVDRPFFGRLSFGDLPAIGEDFEAGSLDPHRASAARTVTSSCATRPHPAVDVDLAPPGSAAWRPRSAARCRLHPCCGATCPAASRTSSRTGRTAATARRANRTRPATPAPSTAPCSGSRSTPGRVSPRTATEAVSVPRPGHAGSAASNDTWKHRFIKTSIHRNIEAAVGKPARLVHRQTVTAAEEEFRSADAEKGRGRVSISPKQEKNIYF